MSFDLERMLKSKEAFRERLARLPIGEKLRLLDALRERTLSIQRASKSGVARKNVVQETPPTAPPADL
jgi:hypothetical protein